MRYPLVDGQGNFGSIDGDPPAAMRYTEIRMQRCHEMLEDWTRNGGLHPNYDESLSEPAVLPAKIPNLSSTDRRHCRRHGHQHPAAQPVEVVDGLASSSTTSDHLR